MNCRSCGNEQGVSILSLGDMPLANRLVPANQLSAAEPTYNLELMLCENCGLVQLKDIVDPTVLFDEYLYFSSNSDTMIASVAKLVENIIPTLPKQATILEIASNDGYLLQHYLNNDLNFNVLGIEPAQNIAAYANAKNIPTRCEYFTLDLAETLVNENYSADIIHANNVMAHVPDTNDFVAGIKKLLKPQGQAIIEVPYLLNLVNHCEFDTIYHEHVYYFSLIALNELFVRHGLMIHHVEEIPLHGGSLRVFVSHTGQRQPSQTVNDMLANERQQNIHQASYYQDFSARIYELKNVLYQQLQTLKNQGKKIAAYGASAKGTTLLNFFGLGKEFIDFVVDRSPHKQGYYTPGTLLEIQPVESLLKNKIDYALLLTWNFAEEILNQQQNYRDAGGKFIIPIPHLQVI